MKSELNINSLLKKALLVVFITFFSCKNSYDSESEFMNCIYSKTADSKSLIKSAIFQHEVYLKTKGIINNNKGKDYKKFIREIGDGKINPNMIEKTLALDVDELDLDVIGCGKKYSSKSSKAKKLRNFFKDILENKKDIKTAFNDFDKIANEEDFEHPFFKICTFVILDYYILNLNE
ncbi:hypothetical protein [uncultured Lacinutrix sp.]|uniref:hypothetical protein n=1 Tax=uncultured Lacinutrix sp. TaxID=574032 RepID=UPI00262148C4|nr:hypothetical protein [uncultured Lacinutrix sp.]